MQRIRKCNFKVCSGHERMWKVFLCEYYCECLESKMSQGKLWENKRGRKKPSAKGEADKMAARYEQGAGGKCGGAGQK